MPPISYRHAFAVVATTGAYAVHCLLIGATSYSVCYSRDGSVSCVADNDNPAVIVPAVVHAALTRAAGLWLAKQEAQA